MANIPINKIMHNGSGVTKLFKNDSVVKKMYRGDDLLLMAIGGKPYIILSTNHIRLNVTGATQTVTVASSNPYTATTTSDWITLEQNGQTLSITASAAQSDREGTVTVSTTNGYFSINETISVSQKNVEFVDYVFVNYGGSNWQNTVRLDTGIVHTASTMSFRIKYQNSPTFTDSSQYSDRLMGYSYQFNNEATGHAITRFFGYNGWSVDYGNGSNRLKGLGLTQADKIYDITWGDFYAYDNDTQSYIKTGTTKSIIGDNTAHIYVDLSFPICEVEIKDGNNVLFNGHAALKDGVYGIWDSVSNQLLTAVNQSNVMTGGYFS